MQKIGADDPDFNMEAYINELAKLMAQYNEANIKLFETKI